MRSFPEKRNVGARYNVNGIVDAISPGGVSKSYMSS